ncbi:hypothetical protein PB2503_13099 [Parvularcula bermudensis HTCC2503]|uniref:Uncharacterized protein n=1 Tax=Parvularcula bermudensis (strain ATCC BAA-594 / HTCC2503 / KCTC 12087) TaxID=314260 RepID=E0TGP8_PARBH|nr:hypothetical protein [Parvularcula bermudensis]ADM10657.1 hypothetical protein PB2503_13099 [Parvularcula bermudensis HTCC2503]
MSGLLDRCRQAGHHLILNEDRIRTGLLGALLLLSWWSTTSGLLALISAGNRAPGIGLTLTIAFAVAVLTLLISWTLSMIRDRRTGLWLPAFIGGYLLLTAISVGFGFGFYWTHIESRASAQRVAAAQTDDVARALSTNFAQLDAAMMALNDVAALSADRATTEAEEGGTCGDTGGAGTGPRYRLRRADAETMQALRSRIAAQLGPAPRPLPAGADPRAVSRPLAADSLYAQKAQLDSYLAELGPERFGHLSASEAHAILEATERTLIRAADRYDAFRNSSAVNGAIETLRARIALGQGPIDDAGIVFTCPDPALEVAMTQAAATLASMPPLPTITFDVPLGADATVAAFGKLGTSIVAPLGLGRGPGLSLRDAVPLLIALAVDLFILLLSVRPGEGPGRRAPGDAAQWLDSPEALQALAEGRQGQSVPTHTDLLEHTFYWRGAYHLALPVESAGEVPLEPAQRGLTLFAMVLSDQGLLKPVRRRMRAEGALKHLRHRFGRHRTRAFRRMYDLYRFEPSGLAKMTSLLLPDTPAEITGKGAVPSADWRGNIRAGAVAPQRRYGAPERPAKSPPPEVETRRAPRPLAPSAYWNSLNTARPREGNAAAIARAAEDGGDPQ